VERHLRADDPERRVRELEAQAARIAVFAELLRRWMTAVSDDQVLVIRQCLEAVQSAEDTARDASATAFSSEPVAGAGSDRWRALWEAARRFALAEGNADHFPPNAGEHCPLCQQNVEDSTAARLRRFEQFIQ